MFFSVIVPIYNAEKTLVRCLESLKAQIFTDFQIILVDDGSTDKSECICKSYVENDSRFFYIRQDNQGVSSARNTGVAYASGKYITFLDSDDIYFINYLQEFNKLILNYPEYDSYWCGFEYISNDEKKDGQICVFSINEEVSLADKHMIMDLHEKTLEASPVNKAYKTSIIRANEILMEKDLSLGEDLLFNYEYLDKCANAQIVILNKSLYGYYCFSEDSLNHKYRADLYEIYERLNMKTLEYLKKWNVSEEQLAKFYSCVFYRMESILRNTFRKECPLVKQEKYKFNNGILRSSNFKQALRMSECYIHPIYRVAYKTCSYRIVQLVDGLVSATRK